MKGLILFSNGMEDNEALSTLALLRRAKITIDSVSTTNDLKIITAYGITLYADKKLSDVDVLDYQFLIIPGGGYVAEVIDADKAIKQAILAFNDKNKDIYAICAAPRFLGQLGLLEDKDYTAFPGSEVDIKNGRYLKHQKVVVGDKIITARSAGAVVDFVYEIVKKNLGKQQAEALLNNIMY